MTLRYRYKLERVNHPVIPLGGRWVRPRPLAAVTLIGPSGPCVATGHLDTGADDTVFPEWMAVRIGVDLRNAPPGQAEGAGGGAIAVRYAEVTLRLAQGNERREWRAWVGFTPARMSNPLLGFAGCLQYFTST